MSKSLHSVRSVVAPAIALLLVIAFVQPAGAELPTGRTGDSPDPTAASIDITTDPHADGSVTRVVLGRNDVSADNLGGSAAAGNDGALLLVDPAPAGLSDAVSAELGRLLGPASAGACTADVAEVLLLGGEAALGAQLAADVDALGYCTNRLSGASRAETSVAIAQQLAGDSRGTLMIARDDNSADSASAGAYAAATGSPIVVTQSADLHPAVIDRLDPAAGPWTEVVLLGGTAALSADVEAAVVSAAGSDTTVRRVAGATRDDTALQVANQLWGATAGSPVALVNGFSENFWTYALPGGVAAGGNNAPLLYVQTDLAPEPPVAI